MNHLIQTTPIRFEIHSILISLNGKVAKTLASDFDFFTNRISEKAFTPFSLSLETEDRTIDPTELPNAPATRIFPECILFKLPHQEIYQYGRDLLLIIERSEHSCSGKLISTNQDLAIEISYLFLQTEIGKFLDQSGMHRVHALGIANKNNDGALFLLPSGGGKSSLARHLIFHKGIRLFSDDSPIIDRLGRMRPYPLSLSFKKGADLPKEWREDAREFFRRKYGNKLLVSPLKLPAENLPRPTDTVTIRYIFLGVRHGTLKTPKIILAKKRAAALPLFRDLVVGLGLPQVVELVLSNGSKSLPRLIKPILSRTISMNVALSRSKVFHLHLSDCSETNAQYITQFLDSPTNK